MRPVEKGSPPAGARTYQEMHPHLEQRLGPYCSYCGRKACTEVDHVVDRQAARSLIHNWGNLLLACSDCNTRKGHREPHTRRGHCWPDTHNTALSFTYQPNGDVTVSPALSHAADARATATLGVVQLAAQGARRGGEDRRRRDRRGVFDLAQDWKGKLSVLRAEGSPRVQAFVASVARTAREVGCWDAWRAVFDGDADMLLALNREFPGTAPNCFDPSGRAVDTHRKP
jgi:uncharacterized protein (TIGR02646 family)